MSCMKDEGKYKATDERKNPDINVTRTPGYAVP
jgi:hypothetical protein